MILAVIESFVLNFVLLLICVCCIRNSPVGGVHFYEEPVKKRVVELGLITEKQIKKCKMLSAIPFLIVILIVMPAMVFFVNKAADFMTGFVQLTIILGLCGLFDRIFIDWYWVGHTKAWFIPGTEDLMPYIPKKTWVVKIVLTVIGYPLLAALLSWVMCLILKI